MTVIIAAALAAFLLSLIGTRLMILTLRKKPVLLDIPNLRSNHTIPTPKGGGIAVTFALIVGMMLVDVRFSIILSMLILASVSLLDDMIGVPQLVRLVVQMLAVGVPLSSVPIHLTDGFLPLWADTFILGLIWVWLINLFNFMDGIDGISATEMFTVGIGTALVMAFAGESLGELGGYGLIFAAAGLGFYWWNRHPAKIFMGDVGSIPIGFMMGYLMLQLVLKGYGYAALILPAYYIADGGITLAKRILRGEKIWQAHSQHYYQRAVRAGRKHSAVVRYITGINILLIYIAIQTILAPDIAIFLLAMAYFAVFMMLGFFAYQKPSPAYDTFDI